MAGMSTMRRKNKQPDAFTEYRISLPEEEAVLLNDFFSEFEQHCLLAKPEKEKMRSDFEKAILYYSEQNVPLREALALLDIASLGGFYARPPIMWFSLDDAAKIYPLSMKHGLMAVFRLSAYLKQPVVPELLQMALTFTIPRFPSFATTLKKGFFWHYLDTAKRRFTAERERGIPCQPLRVSQSGSQSFRVLYWDNRISVEFFHVLTDGTGGMIFLKVLIAEYLRLCGVVFEQDESIWDIHDVPTSEEFENAFANVPRASSASGFADKAATQMSGRLGKNRPSRIVHLKMNASELKAAAGKYNTTVTGYMLAVMFLAQKAATDDLHGEFSIQVPVNMRKYYPSRTARNFAMYCGIRMPIEEIHDIPSMIDRISEQLKEKASKEAMSEMLTATETLVEVMRYIPLAVIQPVAQVVYGFLGDKIFTNTLSNLGVVKLPSEIAAEIDSMDFVLGTAITNRAGCAMVTVNNMATFSITKMTPDPTFEEKIYELLTEDHITVTAEGSGIYEG